MTEHKTPIAPQSPDHPIAGLDPALEQRFQELAALADALAHAEMQLEAASRENIALRQQTVRLQRQLAQGAAADPDGSDLVAAEKQIAALREQITHLTDAVSEKERARFALQEESWAMAEALNTQLEQPPEAPAPSLSGYVQDTVRLTGLLRQAETELRDSQKRITELTQALRFSAKTPQTNAALANGAGADLTPLRGQVTRLMAQRDKAKAQVPDPAAPFGFPNLVQPQAGHVFMVTFGLSGDLELQGLINQIDGICLRGENGGSLGPVAAAWHAAAETLGQDTNSFDHLNRLGWHLAEGFSAAVLAPEPAVRLTGFREIRWPTSETEFHAQLDFLYSFFPNTRFVFHSRDPETVAGLGWWAEQPRQEITESLQKRIDLFNGYMSEHPDRGIHLRYETYREDPDQLAALFDLLETPYHSDLVAAWLQEAQP